MLEKFECEQCGANKYDELESDKIKCNYCGTIYRINKSIENKPKVIIKKGANVVFGKNSNVIIKGGVDIEDGANVQFLGKLEIIQKGDEEKIKNSIYKK